MIYWNGRRSVAEFVVTPGEFTALVYFAAKVRHQRCEVRAA